MNRTRVLTLLVIIVGVMHVCISGTSLGMSDADNKGTTVESYRSAIEQTKSREEKAELYKKLGDLYASEDDFTDAAEQYIRALSLKKNFSEQERVKMAVSISWGDRLDEAIAEFRSILNGNPRNTDARIHLARTLSWAGRFDESLREIEKVLGQSPQNKDGLLIKANDLRWKGEVDQAIPIYRSLLEKEESFDARLGYAAALFAINEGKAAQESMALLNPIYPYQEKELKKLQEKISEQKGKDNAEVKYIYYDDTDGNVVARYIAAYGFSAGNSKNLLTYTHTSASNPSAQAVTGFPPLRNETDSLTAETRIPLSRLVNLGAGIGVIRYDYRDVISNNQNTSANLIGNLRADAEYVKGSAGVSFARAALNDTAELIAKRILFSSAGGYLSRSVTDRFSVYGNYGYKDYSDDNFSNDLLLALRYLVLPENPRTTAGYRFRYLNFNRQSRGGYFDPSNFLSHQWFANISFEKGTFSGFAEAFVGYESYKRYGIGQHEIVGGGTAILDYRFLKNLALGLNIEGGDYAAQTAAGFRYYLFGVALKGSW